MNDTFGELSSNQASFWMTVYERGRWHTPDTTLKRVLPPSPVPRIERNIEFENVNARLAQESPLQVLRVLKNQARDVRFWNLAFRRHAPNLKLRCRWRDIRIESRTRCRNQIDRDGRTGILGLQFGDVSTDASNQLRVGRSEI